MTRASQTGVAAALATAAATESIGGPGPATAPAERGSFADGGGGGSSDGGRTVRLTVNGEPRTVPDGHTLADLLRAHELDPRLVVVERNREILRDRDAFASLALADGDELELVHFVGGG